MRSHGRSSKPIVSRLLGGKRRQPCVQETFLGQRAREFHGKAGGSREEAAAQLELVLSAAPGWLTREQPKDGGPPVLRINREMPLNSVRTRASPGPGGGSGAVRSSTAPLPAYHSARATRVLPAERAVIMLGPAPGHWTQVA